MEFSNRIFTYRELREGIQVENDPYGIAYYEYESRRRTFLANPNLQSEEDMYMYLAFADDMPVGRTTMFKTQLKNGDIIEPLSSGSALEVVESFQKYGLGGEIFYYGYSLKNQKYLISAGISTQALPLYKKLRYHIFGFPKLLLLKDTQPVLRKFGFRGVALKITSSIVNIILSIVNYRINNKAKALTRKYKIKRFKQIPEWVEEMIMNDSHKYSEYHGKAWLQWNLDNNLKGNERDIQSFYGVYLSDSPVGFFMTKERFRADAQGLKNIVIGSFVEWESVCEELDEEKLTLLALNTFSDDVDIIETATADPGTVKKLKKLGFVHKGDAHIAFKDKTKKLKDAGDANLWRLRYGYADVILT